MAAYKKDINLFKAAGGERARSKKMETSKKLMIVAIVVVIILVGSIVTLDYFNKQYTKRLEALETQQKNYEATIAATRNDLATYESVLMQENTAVAIEYQSMLKAGFSSDLSTDEIKAVRDFIDRESTPFYIDNQFDEVVDDVLNELNKVQYRSDAENYADEVYNAKFLYCALSFMKTMQPVFYELPLQYTDDDEEAYYWYCYYRGKFVMFLRNENGDAATFAAQLQSPSDLLCAPFCSLVAQPGSDLSSDNFAMYSTVILEDGKKSYTVLALTCKTVPERFLDCVEAIYAQQTIPNTYSIGEYQFDADGDAPTFSVLFKTTQNETFKLKDVYDAVVASPFFDSKKDHAFEITNEIGPIERTIKFTVVNQAVNATYDAAVAFFTPDVEEATQEE